MRPCDRVGLFNALVKSLWSRHSYSPWTLKILVLILVKSIATRAVRINHRGLIFR